MTYKIAIISIVTILLAFLFVYTYVVHAYTLTTGSNGVNGGVNLWNASNHQAVAQTFTTTTSGSLTSFQGYFNKASSPTDTMTATIQTNNAGVPSGTVLATSNTFTTTDVDPSCLSSTLVTVTFPTPPALSASTQYWIVVNNTTNTQDGGGNYTWCGNNSGTNQGFRFDGASWVDLTPWTFYSLITVSTVVSAPATVTITNGNVIINNATMTI